MVPVYRCAGGVKQVSLTCAVQPSTFACQERAEHLRLRGRGSSRAHHGIKARVTGLSRVEPIGIAVERSETLSTRSVRAYRRPPGCKASPHPPGDARLR